MPVHGTAYLYGNVAGSTGVARQQAPIEKPFLGVGLIESLRVYCHYRFHLAAITTLTIIAADPARIPDVYNPISVATTEARIAIRHTITSFKQIFQICLCLSR